MSDSCYIEANSSVTELTVTANVSVELPVLRCALITKLAEALEHGGTFSLTRTDFLASVADSILERGTESLSAPDSPDCSKIPGGIDHLLREATTYWQEWFPDASNTPHVFTITFSLDREDIVHGYACSLTRGLVEGCGDSPETDGAYTVLHHAIAACVECGYDFDIAAHSSDYETAKATVARVSPDLFPHFQCGHDFGVGRLEF